MLNSREGKIGTFTDFYTLQYLYTNNGVTMSSDGAAVGCKRSRPEDWGKIDPSPVVHIRGLPRHSVELDVVKVFQPYGRIRDVTMMPQKNQALVEFEDMSSAEELIRINPAIKVLSSPVQISFSTSKHIVQRAANRAPADEQSSLSTDNHILLFTIYNTDRPITVETIYRITFSYGNVLRIVIFRKSQVQAMVEFANIQEARKAKLHLNGADIFPGCCTLKVDYARPARLSVPRNDQDNWDFEKCERDPSCNHGDQCQNSLLGYMDDSHYGYDYHYGPYPYDYSYDYGQSYPSECKNMTSSGARNKTRSSKSSSVVMLYNIDINKMNCDRIFNILCIYGNVIRVKFLRTKEGSAMVEMGDGDSATRVIRNLSGVSFMGNQLMIRNSKQDVILDVSSPFQLPDGSPSFKDFSKDRNNRYTTSIMAKKNRVHPPSRTLHYWNAPPKISNNSLLELVRKCGASDPQHIEQFLKTSDKSSSGFLKWATDAEAFEALALCNHQLLKDEECTYPFTIKLAFASPNLSAEPILVASNSQNGSNLVE
ncbi:hypothetical protein MN116_002897 [Schistosoma mekongi]|uniref:RRM domain-containing protein n=1 Tax=Schistosoma mekongi TaxID=38744 RepID=A0AAE1ZGJ3_SCHME|nr:hypothetical protein MN116_002897 [Schistosoma mekongi]